MKAWVRNSRRRARSCQEIDSAVALIAGRSSESRRGAGADDLTRLAPHVAEAVRQLTREIIGFTRAQHACGAADGELDASADHDAGSLATMGEHFLSRGGAGGVTLVQYRELPCRALRGHQ